MCRLREPINNYSNRIKTLHSLPQRSNKVHRDTIPFLLWRKQWLHQTRRLLVFNLRVLTDQTSINELCDLLLHSRPPKQSLQTLIHLCCSWINTQTTSVTFFQNPFLKLKHIWYTNSIMKHQNTVLIQSEVHTFTLINQHHSIHKF